MATDVGRIVKAAMDAATSDGKSNSKPSALSGGRGVAAGAALAALAPLAGKGAAKLAPKVKDAVNPQKLASQAGDKVSEGIGKKVDQAGGVSGMAKEAGKSMLPGGGGGGSGKVEAAGVGKGRRMPVQQAIDVAVPVETAYNQFTQFEDWPNFMHRVSTVSQEDDCTVSFKTKIWGISKEFKAEIETQRPDERIKWKVAQGLTHTGVVTFHELAERLTRIEVNVDVDPGSLIEKAARGMRHVKRAIRADLHRFKAFIEMAELETGAWRGVIVDGELVEPHPDEYDDERDYSDVAELVAGGGSQDGAGEDEEEDQDSQRARTRRFERQARASSGRQRSRSGGGGGRSRPSGSRSGSRSGSGSSSRGSSSSRGGSSSRKSSARSGSRSKTSSRR